MPIGTPEALAGLRRRLVVEEDAQVKLEIEEAISEVEKSCCVVSAKIIGA
jgi:hypothetical protein